MHEGTITHRRAVSWQSESPLWANGNFRPFTHIHEDQFNGYGKNSIKTKISVYLYRSAALRYQHYPSFFIGSLDINKSVNAHVLIDCSLSYCSQVAVVK